MRQKKRFHEVVVWKKFRKLRSQSRTLSLATSWWRSRASVDGDFGWWMRLFFLMMIWFDVSDFDWRTSFPFYWTFSLSLSINWVIIKRVSQVLRASKRNHKKTIGCLTILFLQFQWKCERVEGEHNAQLQLMRMCKRSSRRAQLRSAPESSMWWFRSPPFPRISHALITPKKEFYDRKIFTLNYYHWSSIYFILNIY